MVAHPVGHFSFQDAVEKEEADAEQPEEEAVDGDSLDLRLLGCSGHSPAEMPATSRRTGDEWDSASGSGTEEEFRSAVGDGLEVRGEGDREGGLRARVVDLDLILTVGLG